jgi:hypothetical protein
MEVGVEQYAVDYITGSTKKTELIPAKFTAIKDMARNVVDNGNADRVEVRNSDGEIVFAYPRIMHRA